MLRGMIDEYRFAERRNLLWSQRFRSGWRFLTVLSIAVLIVLNVIQVVHSVGG